MAAISTVQLPIETCQKHEFERLVVYCKDCRIAICVMCSRDVDHLNHNIEGISKYSSEIRRAIPITCQQISDEVVAKMRQEVNTLTSIRKRNNESHQKELENLDKLQEKFMNITKFTFEKKKRERHEVLRKYNGNLETHEVRLKNDIKELEDRIEKHKTSQSEYSEHDVIEMDKSLQELSKQYTPVSWKDNVFSANLGTTTINKGDVERYLDSVLTTSTCSKSSDLYKKARAVLNKLTPQNFQTLVKQMVDLDIDTEKRLKGVTDLVFEKAISEPGFSVAYAYMCRYLTSIKVPSQTKEGDFVNFRAILLTRCQKEFERDRDVKVELDQKRKVINELKEDEKSKEDELKAELELAETKARRRQLGNIRFIGELFKLNMLTENFIHDCLFKLLQANDEEQLECLCCLLSKVGKELEHDTAKNKWTPRRDENNPKPIEPIYKEAQKEEQERQVFLEQSQQQQKSQGGRSGPRGFLSPTVSGSIGSSEGWNTVGKATIRTDRQSIDPSKLKLSRQNVDESNIQLVPGGGGSRFAGWGRGSTGGGARNSQEEKSSSAFPSNRFSALSKYEEENRGRYGVSPARGDSRGRGFGKPPGSRGITPRSSIELEKEKALAAARDIITGQGLSRDSSRESRKPIETEKPVSAPAKQLTEEQIEKKTKSIMDEYCHVHDIKEAILCVEELKSPSTIHVFVSTALNYVLEKSEVARNQTGHFLHDLVKKGILSVDVYIKGLHEILQYAEDMEIHIPKIWQYFGELIGPMIQDGSVPLSFLRQAAQPLKENNKAGNLVAEVLHAASHREGHKKVSTLWRQSSLQWEEFVPAAQKQQFLKEKKLEFTEGEGSQPSTPTVSRSIESIQQTLDDLLIAQNADNEAVFDWIEENCDDVTMKSKKFIRALMTSVCQSAITGKGNNARVVPDNIEMRGVVLNKFLDNDAEFELQALYALQALVHRLEHPPGVLRKLFDTLYDEDIISEDAFNQWEKSTDVAEQEGKGVAMKQVFQFFTWLREAEDFSDS